MGFWGFGVYSATVDSLYLDLDPSMDIQLNKWNSRQILIARARFKKGLTNESPFVLNPQGFLQVFPSLSSFPDKVIHSAFVLFDNDSSGDIDFKEFCYILTIIIHGSMANQENFVFNLFDIDKDGFISLEELSLALESFNIIKERSQLADSTSKAKEILNEKKSLNEEEFIQELTKHVKLKQILELFEVIPSVSSEYRIITEIMKKAENEKQKTCHILSYKWWNIWYNYVKKDKEIKGSVFISIAKEDFWLKTPDMIVMNSDRNSKVDYLNSKEIDGDYNNDTERPGEIDNTNLEGPIKGTLKDDLMLRRDYISIPNEAWKRFIEWYGGGPEFERVILRNGEGKIIIELYPIVLYVVPTGDNGMPIQSYVPLIVSKTLTMREVSKLMKLKFNKMNTECRIWYRLMIQGTQWEMVKNIEKTVKNIGLNNGDKLILESKCGSTWPRDNLKKDELQWEVKDKIDIYSESKKTWEEGIVVENKPGYLCITTSGGTFKVTNNSSIIAPYRTHTVHSIQSTLTPDILGRLVKEFKPLHNLGNT